VRKPVVGKALQGKSLNPFGKGIDMTCKSWSTLEGCGGSLKSQGQQGTGQSEGPGQRG
jgi:hypothetical protein